MSTSRHPIALRLEQHVGEPTKLLATVMGLPLVDGIFPALVLAGALTVPFGILETGLLIFGGSATTAVVLAEMGGTPRQQAASILLLGAVLVPVAAIEAALAPTVASLIDLAVFERFASLVILAIAAKTASARVGEYLPRPGAIVGLGLLASVQPAGATLTITPDPTLVGKAAAAAGVGITFALGIALGGPYLRGRVDLDRFRFGSAVALGTLALSVLGVLGTDQPVALGVLFVAAVLSFDPDESPVLGAGQQVEEPDPASGDAEPAPGPGVVEPNGGTEQDPPDSTPDESSEESESRAPWL